MAKQTLEPRYIPQFLRPAFHCACGLGCANVNVRYKKLFPFGHFSKGIHLSPLQDLGDFQKIDHVPQNTKACLPGGAVVNFFVTGWPLQCSEAICDLFSYLGNCHFFFSRFAFFFSGGCVLPCLSCLKCSPWPERDPQRTGMERPLPNPCMPQCGWPSGQICASLSC